MDLEQRVQALENEIKILKIEIQKTLIAIQETLPDQPAAPRRWQKRAWVLALINMLIAIALFTNIYLYVPGKLPYSVTPTVETWLRAGWVALAFIWLLLQIYPLLLLLEEEDAEWQGVMWRNAQTLLHARPSLLVVLTTGIVVAAVLSAIAPTAWLIVSLILLIAVASVAVRGIVDAVRGHRASAQSGIGQKD